MTLFFMCQRVSQKWLVKKKFPTQFAEQFPELSSVTLQLLWDRGVRSQRAVDEFFHPDYEADSHDPFLMKDMSVAVRRTFAALLAGERVLVYGDYDVDGVTATAVLVNTLRELGRVLKASGAAAQISEVEVYIPDREREGYGITAAAIKEIKRRKITLMLTVDCGVSNVLQVEELKEAGVEVIVTDHHHVPEVRPEALAIINPKQPDCAYPFKLLAGVGVVFKVAQALLMHLKKNFPAAETLLAPGFEKWLLDLVALGTVADCVDLVGENRTLTTYGLLVLNKTRRVGLKQLIEIAGLDTRENGNFVKGKSIDTINISFNLAPRLNAAGRMDHANTSYGLLVSEDVTQAVELAGKLEKSNQVRQRLTDKMIKEIRDSLVKKKELPKVLVVCGEEWKIGVVGLVAGRLTEEFARPFLVLTKKEGALAGSGRSVPAFNLIEAIESCSDLLTQFGGHAQAAGVKLPAKNLRKFKRRMEERAAATLTEEDLQPVLEIDAEVTAEEINWQLVEEVGKFAPFGFANRRPVFLVRDLEVQEARPVGVKQDHLRLTLKCLLADNHVKYFPAIGFRLAHLLEDISARAAGVRWGDRVDVAFQPEINEWNGNRELQLNLVDVRLSKRD